MIKGIKTNIVDTCLSNIRGSEVLRDDFASAARHVADFIVTMKSRDIIRNHNISGFDTDQGGGGGQGREGGPGRGGQSGGGGRSGGGVVGGSGIPPQDAVDSCNHITKLYYPEYQYNLFTPTDK